MTATRRDALHSNDPAGCECRTWRWRVEVDRWVSVFTYQLAKGHIDLVKQRHEAGESTREWKLRHLDRSLHLIAIGRRATQRRDRMLGSGPPHWY